MVDHSSQACSSDIGSEMGVQGALSPAGVRGVSALSLSPRSGLQARQNQYEQMSVFLAEESYLLAELVGKTR